MVANLYMEFCEELALETVPTRPRLWKRYVDDTFCILRKGLTEEFLHHLMRHAKMKCSIMAQILI